MPLPFNTRYEAGYYYSKLDSNTDYIRITDIHDYFEARRLNKLYEYDGYSMNKIDETSIGIKSYIKC